MYRDVLQRAVSILGVWSIFLPFIIERILGIKRIFPCSFGNKRMCLLTCVYGMLVHAVAVPSVVPDALVSGCRLTV